MAKAKAKAAPTEGKLVLKNIRKQSQEALSLEGKQALRARTFWDNAVRAVSLKYGHVSEKSAGKQP